MKKPVLVDANVLLRFLLADDLKQSPEATALFTHAPPGTLVLGSVTLAEVAWVLLSHYRVPREQVSLALQRVKALPSVQTDTVTRDAVARFAATPFDFADCLLAAQAAHTGTSVVTFDKDFRRFPDIVSQSARIALQDLKSR